MSGEPEIGGESAERGSASLPPPTKEDTDAAIRTAGRDLYGTEARIEIARNYDDHRRLAAEVLERLRGGTPLSKEEEDRTLSQLKDLLGFAKQTLRGPENPRQLAVAKEIAEAVSRAAVIMDPQGGEG